MQNSPPRPALCAHVRARFKLLLPFRWEKPGRGRSPQGGISETSETQSVGKKDDGKREQRAQLQRALVVTTPLST